MLSELISGNNLQLLIGCFAGLICAFLNTVASSGSAVSLPLLIVTGLDPITANATNRVPVLIGAVTASFVFFRKKLINWWIVSRLVPIIALGAGAGAVIADAVPARHIGFAITAAILIAFLLLFTKIKSIVEKVFVEEPRFGLRETVLFFLIGLWLGFLVLDGATYLLLGLVLMARLPLMEANAAKTVALIPASLIALVIFHFNGLVDWEVAGALAVGSVAGGMLGGKVAGSIAGKKWIFRLLALVLVGEVVHLSAHFIFRAI